MDTFMVLVVTNTNYYFGESRVFSRDSCVRTLIGASTATVSDNKLSGKETGTNFLVVD